VKSIDTNPEASQTIEPSVMVASPEAGQVDPLWWLIVVTPSQNTIAGSLPVPLVKVRQTVFPEQVNASSKMPDTPTYSTAGSLMGFVAEYGPAVPEPDTPDTPQ